MVGCATLHGFRNKNIGTHPKEDYLCQRRLQMLLIRRFCSQSTNGTEITCLPENCMRQLGTHGTLSQKKEIRLNLQWPFVRRLFLRYIKLRSGMRQKQTILSGNLKERSLLLMLGINT